MIEVAADRRQVGGAVHGPADVLHLEPVPAQDFATVQQVGDLDAAKAGCDLREKVNRPETIWVQRLVSVSTR